MLDRITYKSLYDFVKSGAKIYKISESSGEIEIIKGIVFLKHNPEILISKYKIEFSVSLKKLIQSKKFQDALYKPKTRGVVLIDVADYSKGDSLYFASILTVFNTLINNIVNLLETKNKLVEQIIPTGDGCYMVFNESMNSDFFKIVFMIINEMNKLQSSILKKFSKKSTFQNKLHLRISCTLNETDFFRDVAGNRNCYGIGLNEAERILDSGQNEVLFKYPDQHSLDSVFFDETVLDQAKNILESLKEKTNHKPEIKNLGVLNDKHGIKRNIWWLKSLSPIKIKEQIENNKFEET
jgi:hypothetical protein